MERKAQKLIAKYNTTAKQMTEDYLKLELPKVQRKAQMDALFLLHQSGKLKGTKIGDMLDRKDFPWEGDKPVPLRAHMFEVREILV